MEAMAATKAPVASQSWRWHNVCPRPQCAGGAAPAFVKFRRCPQVRLEYVSRRGVACRSASFSAASPFFGDLDDTKLASSVAQETVFTWNDGGNEVQMTADFLNWEKVPLQKNASGSFSTKQKLRPGKYAIKFIVDGIWRHSSALPTVSDNIDGFNNEVTVVAAQPPPVAQEAEEVPKAAKVSPPAAAAAAEPVPDPVVKLDTQPPAMPAAAKPAPAPPPKPQAAPAKKAVAKSLANGMLEDVIPALTTMLAKEDNVRAIQLAFEDNQLRGTFFKSDVPYSFWALFPDGTYEGSRGFALSSYGNSPSTIEPFLVDEKKITPDLLVFWITKRLFAQKILSVN